ncbi:hypothetical protein FRE64_07735 [Euhalothece natronophila Z-M001]|uniref:Uncharacterized protein n=1 Tax=Euhalothece natronophila Z-M001 TaxID=522448 RepID=A0A5B8NKR2_9CHRO|nr:hypothetical protein [Euhalothece natronophila]QDZ39842.1 hypothetical protein FRE64_07735 [Euhalothece natronophila Z-M001]
MTSPKTSNLKKSIIAAVTTATLSGLALGLVPEARSQSSSPLESEESLLALGSSVQLMPTTDDGTPDGYS